MFNKILFTVNKNTKKNLILSILIATFITGLTMETFLVVSTDFSYFRFGHSRYSGPQGIDYSFYPKTAEFNISNVGKTTIGQGGFPISYYRNCVLVSRYDNKVDSVCKSLIWGRNSIAPLLMPLLDVLIWIFFFYSLLIFIQALKKRTNRKKTISIFIIAIAVLILSVFANDFIGSNARL